MANNSTTELDLLKSVTTSGGATDTLNVVGTVGLPSGAATAARQDTGNTNLSSIDNKLTTLNGQTDGVEASLTSLDGKTTAVDTGNVLQKAKSISGSGTLSSTGEETVEIVTTGMTEILMNFVSNSSVGPSYAFESQVGTSAWFPVTTMHTLAYDGQLYTTLILSLFAGGKAQFRTSVVGTDKFRLRGGMTSGSITYQMVTTAGNGVLDGILGTVYCNVGTSALPSGAATEASLAKLTLAQASTTSGQTGALALTATTTAVPTYVTAKSNPLNTNTSGGLRVDVAQINGVTPLMGAGNTGTGSPRVTIATDQAAVPVSQSGTWTVQPGNTANTTAWLASIIPTFSTRSDTFTTTSSGTTVSQLTKPVSSFSILAKATGTVTSWDVRLEGSNDNSNFTQILQHTNVTPGDGLMVYSGATISPCLYFRSRCAGLVLGAGTNVVVTILGIA